MSRTDPVTVADTLFSERAPDLVARAEQGLKRWLEPLPADGARLAEAMRYATLGGGKRLRPLLVYAAGEALGLRIEALDAPAMAVELIHCYSLVHDDLPAMDDDPLRRGRPTTHLAFDEATAILAGDALQAMAFEVLAGVDDAEAARSMSAELARACGVTGMAGGQALDLHYEGRRPDQAAVEAMGRQKTGALIRAAVMLPACLRPQLDRDQRQALSQFADAVGLGFQIRDDLLEVEGDTAAIGKSCRSDANRKKASWPMLFGPAAARRRIDELSEQAAAALARVTGNSDGLQWLADRLLKRCS